MLKLYQHFRSLPLVRKFIAIRREKQSHFYQINRKDVLSSYRFLLKTVPSIYPRRLQQRSSYIQICYLFHKSKVLSSIQQTRFRRDHLMKLVQQIRQGDYSNIGIYLPARQGQMVYVKDYMKNLMAFRTHR